MIGYVDCTCDRAPGDDPTCDRHARLYPPPERTPPPRPWDALTRDLFDSLSTVVAGTGVGLVVLDRAKLLRSARAAWRGIARISEREGAAAFRALWRHHR